MGLAPGPDWSLWKATPEGRSWSCTHGKVSGMRNSPRELPADHVPNAVLTISAAGTDRGWGRKLPGMGGNRNILTHPSCQRPAFTWLALLESEAWKRAAETGFELSHERGHIYNYINSIYYSLALTNPLYVFQVLSIHWEIIAIICKKSGRWLG